MSRRSLLAAGLAAVAVAAGCSSGGDTLADGGSRRACLRGAGEIDEPLVTFS